MLPAMTTSTTAGASTIIRAEAARRNLSQREVAERIGMSQASFSRRMNGEQPWDLNELDKLADLFRMDVREFIPLAAAVAS